ncbi:MAG: insulinase family protein, partial [Calditrichaeota bacterium]|nr:insulinase family protein [Calditrichota bacterium]
SPYWALVPWEDFKSWPDQMAALKPSQLAETAKKWLIRDDRYSMIIEPEMFEEENTNIATEFSIKTERLAGPGEPTVIIRTDPSARVFALHILFKDRWMWDKVYGTGAVDMLHRLILEGKDKRGRSVTTRLDEISATLKTVDNPGIPYDNYYNSPEYSFLRFETLPENWDKGIDLVFDLLKDIPIDEKNIAVPREANQNSPISIGRKKLRRTLFPSTYLSAKMHWEQDIIVKKKLTDLKISYFNPENMIISVSGPINSDDVFRNIIAEAKPLAKKSFIAQKSPEFNLKEIAAQEPISDTLTVGKAQGALLMCKIIPDISDIDQVALMIANSYFSNQLQINLREQQGLAYSLGSSLTLNRTSENVIWGLWEISISTRPENLTKANSGIQSVLKELLEHEFNSEEISRLSNSIAGRQMMRDMPRIGQAYAMGIGEFYWSDPERRQFVTDQILDMTPEEVTSAARKYLKFDSFNRMIVN